MHRPNLGVILHRLRLLMLLGVLALIFAPGTLDTAREAAPADIAAAVLAPAGHPDDVALIAKVPGSADSRLRVAAVLLLTFVVVVPTVRWRKTSADDRCAPVPGLSAGDVHRRGPPALLV